MKLTHLLPITALVAGCGSITPVPPSAPVAHGKPISPVSKPLADCIAGVEIILEYPYGDGLTLQMMRPDSCADRLGEFLHRHKLERGGQLVFAPGVKLPPGVRQRVLDVLVSRSETGAQEVLVGGKPLSGKQKERLLLRVEELDRDGAIEKAK